MSEIRDIELYPSGERKIQWAKQYMPLLRKIEEEFKAEQPFKGLKIALSIHLEAKTAYLCRCLHAGGAEMYISGSNPLSTQDDIAAALVKGGLNVFAFHACSAEEYDSHIKAIVDSDPDIIIDDGGDIVSYIHEHCPEKAEKIIGGCEETTTGVIRLNSMAKSKTLLFPMFAVNNANCKYLFDNRYGTGQSVWDGINRTTNLVVAGKNVVVAGYGWCGKGVAMRAKGLGADVIITEVDPIKAMEAVMDGFKVMPMNKAAEIGDFFVTVTGCRDVIMPDSFMKMKDGAVLANAGHFNVEVNVEELEKIAVDKYEARNSITAYVLENGRKINVIGEGRLVNLAAGDGHPVEIMDMSFAIQALCARHLALHKGEFENDILPVPKEIDRLVAQRKLAAWGVEIDKLTDVQEKYLASWQM